MNSLIKHDIINMYHPFRNVDVYCDMPEAVEGADIIFSGRDPGDVVIYQCHHGRKYPDGSTRKAVICLNSGQWSNVVPECPGESLF